MTFALYASALNTNDTRNRNLAAVLQAIREHEGLSRTEIGQAMPFSLQTMTNVVQELIGMGLIEEFERPGSGKKGSPHRGLRIVGARAYALGVQIRWNSCRLVLVDLNLAVAAEQTVSMRNVEAEAYLMELLASIQDFLHSHPDKPVWAGAISAPLALEVPNVPQYQNVGGNQWEDSRWFRAFWRAFTVDGLQKRLNAVLPFPVSVINNPQSAALAESQVRPIASRFIYIHMGLGLGAAFVSGRSLNRDFWRQAGEIGHVVMAGAIIGSTLSVSALRTALALDEPQGKFEPLIDAAFQANHPALVTWLDQAAGILRFIINFLENAMWPDGIVVGGFLPRPLLSVLIEKARPLNPSVVLADDHRDRIMPRFAVAKRSSEAIPLGAAISQFDARANPGFADLLGRHRRVLAGA